MKEVFFAVLIITTFNSCSKNSNNSSANSMTGNWTGNISWNLGGYTPGVGSGTLNMSLTQSDTLLNGNYTITGLNDQGSISGKISGQLLTLKLTSQTSFGTSNYSGIVNSQWNEVTGSIGWTSPFGSGTFDIKKK